MHAQTLLFSLLTLGVTIQALPASASDSLSLIPRDALPNIPISESALLPRHHKKKQGGAAQQKNAAGQSNKIEASACNVGSFHCLKQPTGVAVVLILTIGNRRRWR